MGKVDSIRVRWADGSEEVLNNLTTKQTLTLNQKNATPTRHFAKLSQPVEVRLKEVALEKNLLFNHQEDDYLDFKTQALLPHLHSRLGRFWQQAISTVINWTMLL